MEHNSRRLGSKYGRRSFVATASLALILAATVANSSLVFGQDAGTKPTAVQTTPTAGDKKQTIAPQTGGAKTPAPPTDPPGTVHIVPTPRGQGRGNRRNNPTNPATGTPTDPTGAAADPAAGGATGGGFQPRRDRAGTMVSLDFHGTDITNVLKVFATATQMPIVADPGITGPVTIIAPKQVTLDEAFRILQSVLSVRGYTAIQTDTVISIVPFPSAVANTTKVNATIDPTKMDPRNMVITQVIPLENVDADAMAKDLQPLINKGASLVASGGSNAIVVTDTSQNVQRMIDLVSALDKTSSRSEMAVYQLHHAEASGLADLINTLYGKITTRGKGGAAPQPGQPNFNPQQQGQQQSTGTPSVYAVAEQGTNSLIVVASRETQEQITQNIINKIDDDDASTLTTKLRKIKYADATTLASTINQTLSDQHGLTGSSSGGGSSFQQRAFGGFGGGFGGFFGGGGGNSGQTTQSSDPFAKVAPDARTNNILITATPEKMVKIDELIDQLDVNIAVESTTFVIPLKNAQASDVAAALGQAFGTSQSSQNNNFNPFFGGQIGGGGSTNAGGANGHTPIQRRQSASGTGRAVNGRPPGPPNAPDGGSQGDISAYGSYGSAIPAGIPGYWTANGFVPTQDDVSQTADARSRQFGGRFGGGGFGGFGQQRSGIGQSSQPTGGPGQNGSFTGLLQLQNNVYAVASPNGDSIIVTTTPNNYEAIKGIVDALDVIPRQVMIEVIVAEVSLDTDQKLGFNMTNAFKGLLGSPILGAAQVALPATGFGTGTVVDAAQTGLQAVISSTNHAGLIQALGTDAKVKVLATPSVFTSNNQPAVIEIITQIPYITGQSSSGIISTTVSNQVTYAKIGFTLDVTPRITRDGLVTVDVVEDASDLVNYQTLGSGANAQIAPIFNDRYTDTSITVKDGDTAVIGGLIRDRTSLNVTKIPVLSDLPILGQFFRSHDKVRSKVELMIFVTPHVVSSPEQSKELANRVGAPIIKQIDQLPIQQPNLKLTPPAVDTNKSTKGSGKAPKTMDKQPETSTPVPPQGGPNGFPTGNNQ